MNIRTASFSIVYSDEAITEVDDYLNNKQFYIDSSGKMPYSVFTDTVKYLLHNLTRRE